MGPENWDDPDTRALGLLLATPGESLLALLNASEGDVEFLLPNPAGAPWGRIVDTADDLARPGGEPLEDGSRATLIPHAMMVLESATL